MNRFTVKDLKEHIKNLDNNLVLIYSHDDNGNEFQTVISMPSIAYVKNKNDTDFLILLKK
jgi:hypothetical protein